MKLYIFITSLEGTHYPINYSQTCFNVCINNLHEGQYLYKVRVFSPNIQEYSFTISEAEFYKVQAFVTKYEHIFKSKGALIKTAGYIDFEPFNLKRDTPPPASAPTQKEIGCFFDWGAVENENLPYFEPIFTSNAGGASDISFFSGGQKAILNKKEFKRRLGEK